MKVVATWGGHENIVLKARTLKPRVVLLDLGLPNRNGLRMVASLTKEAFEVKVIGMGLIPTQLDVVEFVQVGASGFILKDATVKDFLATIRSVVRGEKVLPPPLTHSLFSHVVEYAFKNGKVPRNSAVKMTKREREVIALIVDALSNKEIAERLHIATYTVKSHVHNILEKLALHSRLEIAMHTHNDESQPD
jgi:two-component system NarL family response regulator